MSDDTMQKAYETLKGHIGAEQAPEGREPGRRLVLDVRIVRADLLPEVAFHDHDRVKLTLALLLGVAVAVGIAGMDWRVAAAAAIACREVSDSESRLSRS